MEFNDCLDVVEEFLSCEEMVCLIREDLCVLFDFERLVVWVRGFVGFLNFGVVFMVVKKVY